jgi:purine-binding chemotaxis protein CheW
VSQQFREVLVFEVGGQCYAVAVDDVQELVRAVALTPLPRAPAVVEGVINLRGRPVPVLDVRHPFRLPSRPLALTDHLVVIRAGNRLAALRVDRALDLVRLGAAALEQGEALLPGVSYVAQVAGFPRGLVLIRDLRAFLSAAEAEELAAAVPAAVVGEGAP